MCACLVLNDADSRKCLILINLSCCFLSIVMLLFLFLIQVCEGKAADYLAQL